MPRLRDFPPSIAAPFAPLPGRRPWRAAVLPMRLWTAARTSSASMPHSSLHRAASRSGGDFLAGKGEEGADVADFVQSATASTLFFRFSGIGDHDGAVVVILRAGGLLMLVEHAGVENGLDALVDQPLHMAVGAAWRDSTRIRRGWTPCPARKFRGWTWGREPPESPAPGRMSPRRGNFRTYSALGECR